MVSGPLGGGQAHAAGTNRPVCQGDVRRAQDLLGVVQEVYDYLQGQGYKLLKPSRPHMPKLGSCSEVLVGVVSQVPLIAIWLKKQLRFKI